MVTHEIVGDDMQAVVLRLGRGDVVRAEAGAMMYMTQGIDMQTLPFSRLADRIHAAYRGDVEDTKRDCGGTLGKIGNILGGE